LDRLERPNVTPRDAASVRVTFDRVERPNVTSREPASLRVTF